MVPLTTDPSQKTFLLPYLLPDPLPMKGSGPPVGKVEKWGRGEEIERDHEGA